mmetsp:Transcript_81121/g.173522  ORF Transcript_81121/g.173522 Transcript_81121/m.173522 type:complete len:267 (-) Transcript_81121:589-1389(-)
MPAGILLVVLPRSWRVLLYLLVARPVTRRVEGLQRTLGLIQSHDDRRVVHPAELLLLRVRQGLLRLLLLRVRRKGGARIGVMSGPGHVCHMVGIFVGLVDASRPADSLGHSSEMRTIPWSSLVAASALHLPLHLCYHIVLTRSRHQLLRPHLVLVCHGRLRRELIRAGHLDLLIHCLGEFPLLLIGTRPRIFFLGHRVFYRHRRLPELAGHLRHMEDGRRICPQHKRLASRLVLPRADRVATIARMAHHQVGHVGLSRLRGWPLPR